MMSGIAKGISTLARICISLMPLARAASTVVRSTDSIPAYAPASVEGIARIVRAVNAAANPVTVNERKYPKNTDSAMRRPSVGMARAPPVSEITNCRPRPVCPM